MAIPNYSGVREIKGHSLPRKQKEKSWKLAIRRRTIEIALGIIS